MMMTQMLLFSPIRMLHADQKFVFHWHILQWVIVKLSLLVSWGLQKVHSNSVPTVCAVLKLTRGYTTKVLPRVSNRCVQALPTQWNRIPWPLNHAWWGPFAMLMFISAPVHTIHCIACIFQSYNVHIRGPLCGMNPSTCAQSSKASHLFL